MGDRHEFSHWLSCCIEHYSWKIRASPLFFAPFIHRRSPCLISSANSEVEGSLLQGTKKLHSIQTLFGNVPVVGPHPRPFPYRERADLIWKLAWVTRWRINLKLKTQHSELLRSAHCSASSREVNFPRICSSRARWRRWPRCGPGWRCRCAMRSAPVSKGAVCAGW